MGAIYCDLDGTFIKGDLEREFIKYLKKDHLFKAYHYLGALFSIPFNYIQKKRYHGSLLKSWSLGFTDYQLEELFSDFLMRPNKNLELNRKTVELLENFKTHHKLVLLTGSHERLVHAFLEYYRLQDFFDEVIGCKVKTNGYVIQRHPYGIDKCRYIDGKQWCGGVANEYADHYYLSLCNEVYIVPGDNRLERLATVNEWRIL